MRLFKPNVGKMLERKDINGLLKAVDDKDDKISDAAIEALGQIGDANAARLLVEKLPKGYGVFSGPLLMNAARRLGGANNKVAVAIGKINSQDVVPDLISLINDPNNSVSLGAIEALGELKSQEAVPALIPALKAENSTKRTLCAWALGMIRDDRAIPALHNSLNDDAQEVRSRAILALAVLGDKSAVPAIRNLLRDPKVSCEAAMALATLEGKATNLTLVDSLEVAINFPKQEADWAIDAILDAIASLKDPSVIPSLLQFKQTLKPQISGNVQYSDSLKDFTIRKIEEVVAELR